MEKWFSMHLKFLSQNFWSIVSLPQALRVWSGLIYEQFMHKCLGPIYHKSSNDFQSLCQLVLHANLASKQYLKTYIARVLTVLYFVNHLCRNFIEILFSHLGPSPGSWLVQAAFNPFFSSRKQARWPVPLALFAALSSPVPQPVAPSWRPLSFMEHIPALPWARAALIFLLMLHPVEGAVIRRRLSGPSNHRPLKECSTSKIYIVCHCWANYFFRKVRKIVWEPDVGIRDHTMLLFL